MTKTKGEIQHYRNEYRKTKRRERGLMKRGRPPYNEEKKAEAKKRKDIYQAQWRKDNPYKTRNKESRLLWAAKRRSIQEDVPFNLEITDIIVPQYCPYLGIELLNTSPRGSKRNAVASLDKIIPELGYTKGNIEVISQQANTMKSDATIYELVLFAKEVLSRYG